MHPRTTHQAFQNPVGQNVTTVANISRCSPPGTYVYAILAPLLCVIALKQKYKMSGGEGLLPEIVVCPHVPGMEEPIVLDRAPFEVGDQFIEEIYVANHSLTFILYNTRTIEILDEVQQVTFIVKKTSELTRRVHLCIKFADGRFDSYRMLFTLDSDVEYRSIMF
ncbi:hypothetical protein CBL_13009 [Carabus blaptoides fortunei]